MEKDHLIHKIKNVDFELTYLCNLDCKHCYNPTHHKSLELSTQKIKFITKEIKDVGFEEIHFNGGEPLLRKDIYKILNYSSDLSLKTLLETNAVLLTDPRKITGENLIVRASIDGPEKIHNKIRKNKSKGNVYRTALKNLIKAKEYGIKIQVTCSVNKINYNSLYKMVEDLYQNGLVDIRLRLSMPAGYALKHWNELEMTDKDLKYVYTLSKKIFEDFPNVNFDYSSIKRNIPESEPKFFIEPRGLVKPYPFIESFVGDLKKDSVEEILKKIQYFELPAIHKKRIISYLTKIGLTI